MNSKYNDQDKTVICVVMLGLLGDVLMRTPVVRELKNLFPNSLIICIADPIGAEVLRLNKNVDLIWIVNRKRKNLVRYIKEKAKIIALVLLKKFDFFIDLYGGSFFRSIALFIRAEKMVFVTGLSIELLPKPQQIDRFAKLNFKNPYHLSNTCLQAISYTTNKVFNLSTRPDVDTRLVSIQLPRRQELYSRFSSREFCFISAGSGDLEKTMPRDILVDLLAWINRVHALRLAILCNPGQEFLQKEISDQLKTREVPHLCVEKLSIQELSLVLPLGRLFVVPDTGLFHLAVALDICTLGILHTLIQS